MRQLRLTFSPPIPGTRYTGPSGSPPIPGQPGWRSFELPASLECVEVTKSGHIEYIETTAYGVSST
jgi:hypothetical protein